MDGETLADGTAVYRFVPTGAVATLLFAHGYAESASRHEPFFRRCAANGIALWAFDFPGHGRSPGTRLFIRRFDDLIATSLALRREIAAGHPRLPPFLMGYSLGGLLSVRSAEVAPAGIAGVVLAAPGLGVARHVPPLVRRLGVAVGNVAPHVPVARLSLRALRPDDDVLATSDGRRIPRDPLIPARTAAESMRASHAAFLGATAWMIPTLLVHGERDRLVPLSGPRRFAALAPSPDFTFVTLPNGHHDVLSGADGDAVQRDILAWILARSREPEVG